MEEDTNKEYVPLDKFEEFKKQQEARQIEFELLIESLSEYYDQYLVDTGNKNDNTTSYNLSQSIVLKMNAIQLAVLVILVLITSRTLLSIIL